jgi:3-isopropylmalate/(R)-2-methylmalate dehydratase large subunit
MTICNMSIEGGARIGYVNPDETTFAFLRGRRSRPPATPRIARRLVAHHGHRRDAAYGDRVAFDASTIEPTVTWDRRASRCRHRAD